jgi:hypothetical protein
MAERLVTLPAKLVAWVRFPVPARPTFGVEKWLFSVTLAVSGGTIKSMQYPTEKNALGKAMFSIRYSLVVVMSQL